MGRSNHAHIFDVGLDPAPRREHPLSCGERRLMLAVLEDALRTVLDGRVGRSSDVWVKSELGWFMSTDRSHPFAFEVICDVLDLDASWLRRRLRDERSTSTRARAGMVRRVPTCFKPPR